MAKCNIDSIAGAEILSRFCGYLTPQEEEQVEEKFDGLLFYETFGCKNYRDCYCTKCKSKFDVWKSGEKNFFRAHHNDYTDCPYCGQEVQLKSLGRIKNFSNLDQTITAAFIRVDQEGNLMISAGFVVRQIWGLNDLCPQIYWKEKCRYYLSPGGVAGWKRSVYELREWMFGPQPWEPTKNICKPFQENVYYRYTDKYWLFGIEKLEKSKFRYCQIEEWYHAETKNWLCEVDDKVRLCIEYLAEYAMHPQIEMAVKLGMSSVVTDLCNGRKNHRDLNWNADKPWKFLRLSKADAKLFLASPSLTLLQWLHEEQRSGAQIQVGDMVRLWKSTGGESAKKLASCALRCKVSPQKAQRYLQSVRWHTGLGDAAELWYDYLDMAVKLEYDLNRQDVLMPKDLRARHDAAAQTIQAEADDKAAKAFTKRLKMLREKYEFELDGLRVVVPETARQIVEEGNTLHHCVGGYAARHINGKTTILFLRRSRRPERSYITIEMTGMEGNQIAQIHGYKNEHYFNAVSPQKRYEHFFSVWLEWLRNGSKRDRSGKPVLPQKTQKGSGAA